MKCNASSLLGRRAFLQLAGLAAAGSCLEPFASAAEPGSPQTGPTHILRVRETEVELAAGRRVTTTTYNGEFPGPLLRATVGQPVRVDVHNETDTAERIYWQGQSLSCESTSRVPVRSAQRMEFTPQRPGLYLYHSQVVAATNLRAGLYSGQTGTLLVEPRNHAGRYDREWVIVLKGCEPFLRRAAHGCEVGYCALTLNGRLPGQGSPVRIKNGERILVHVLNAGATETYRLELPGHVFEIKALDGCRVRAPRPVAALHLSPGERISAYVVMNRPSRWQLCCAAATLDLQQFDSERCGDDAATSGALQQTFTLVLARQEAARSGFNRWTLNGKSFSMGDLLPALRVQHGARYRLKIHNTSDEIVPIHLQRHRLQLVTARGPAQGRSPRGAIVKDVVAIAARQQVELDFVADNQGPALLHSTRQWQSDFGLMARVDCGQAASG